jgi:lipopolysaccharide transport system ATP-binding protein
MPADPIIEITQLGKRFRVYDQPLDRLKEWLTPRGMSFHWAFWALRDINLRVRRGCAMGIIGTNGAGKSTLLKVLCGTLSPTTGTVHIRGRIAGMLELGAGFHPEFTGRQNIYLNARLLGLSDADIAARLPRIIAFAELGDFLDHPLRIYSTGMALRLGFSVAAHVDPDILIIDEALAVGDAYFQQKCLQYLRAFRARGGTLLFVSHDPSAVKLLCDEAVLLHEGAIIERGAPDDVLNYYNALIARRTTNQDAFRIERRAVQAQQSPAQRAGTFDAVISAVEILCRAEPTRAIAAGDEMQIAVSVTALADVAEPTVGIAVRDRLGYEVFGTNTCRLQQTLPHLHPGDMLTATFTLPCNLGPGDYTVTAAVHAGVDHLGECYDWADRYLVFKVLPDATPYHCGVARLPVSVAIETVPSATRSQQDVLRALFADAPQRIRFDDETAAWTFGGWHAIEKIGADSVRWTNAAATFVVAVGPRARLRIEACTDAVQCAGAGLGLHIMVNGVEAGVCRFTTPAWHICELALPAHVAGTVARVALHCERTFIPAEVHGSDDRRTLGILVRAIDAA